MDPPGGEGGHYTTRFGLTQPGRRLNFGGGGNFGEDNRKGDVLDPLSFPTSGKSEVKPVLVRLSENNHYYFLGMENLYPRDVNSFRQNVYDRLRPELWDVNFINKISSSKGKPKELVDVRQSLQILDSAQTHLRHL